MSAPPMQSFIFHVTPPLAGKRLDILVAREVEACTRSFAAQLIRKGRVTVDGAVKKPGYTVKSGETVCGELPPPEANDICAEAIPLDILFEDSHLLAVNKAPGMVVHPAPGHHHGTLVNALMHHCPDLQGISGTLRPGIVHRLDKDTSGVLVVAKNGNAMQHLSAQFTSRQVRKKYCALIYGIPELGEGTIDLPIGRHPVDRKRMSVFSRTPRSAVTHWRVEETYQGASLLDLDIRTGRTHQIRVHCQAMGHPIIGDPVYGHRRTDKRLAGISSAMGALAKGANRQMLHARKLQIVHPVKGRAMFFTAPIPLDMQDVIDRFRALSDCFGD